MPGPLRRRPGSRGLIDIVLGGVLELVVLGGILTVVVLGGRLSFFLSGCNNPHGQRGPAFALLVDPPTPCANPTTATNAQPITKPQATDTPLTQATATTAAVAPKPTNSPLPQPPKLTVTPLQATGYCLNGRCPSLTVQNTDGKTLSWSASGPGNAQITLTPTNESLAPGDSQTVAVSGPRPEPTVSIAFSGNGGNATITYTCQ